MKTRERLLSIARIFAAMVVLTFLPIVATGQITNCIPPAGLVGWWPAEGTAIDIIGTNNGSELNGVIYTNGA